MHTMKVNHLSNFLICTTNVVKDLASSVAADAPAYGTIGKIDRWNARDCPIHTASLYLIDRASIGGCRQVGLSVDACRWVNSLGACQHGEEGEKGKHVSVTGEQQ